MSFATIDDAVETIAYMLRDRGVEGVHPSKSVLYWRESSDKRMGWYLADLARAQGPQAVCNALEHVPKGRGNKSAAICIMRLVELLAQRISLANRSRLR